MDKIELAKIRKKIRKKFNSRLAYHAELLQEFETQRQKTRQEWARRDRNREVQE